MAHEYYRGFEVGADVKVLPALPLELLFWSRPATVTAALQGDEHVFQIGLSGEATESLVGSCDFPVPTQVREAFLRVVTPADALKFLTATGRFLWEIAEERLTWTAFQRWQDIVRAFGEQEHLFLVGEGDKGFDGELAEAMKSAPEDTKEWLSGLTPGMSISGDSLVARAERRRPKLKLSLNASTTVNAVLASIAVGRIVGTDFALCGRRGCGALFEQKPTRGKRYCSQKCAHHANVTERRRIERAQA